MQTTAVLLVGACLLSCSDSSDSTCKNARMTTIPGCMEANFWASIQTSKQHGSGGEAVTGCVDGRIEHRKGMLHSQDQVCIYRYTRMKHFAHPPCAAKTSSLLKLKAATLGPTRKQY